ncbi:MAG: hypothetical protein JRF42_05110 [Deltaproteobacteria bacterium]|nr:hypothetical protein [Deltaproteobacteria bacterium]MBW2718872.1 hypothetical protein [Deltaproteobacteria bacterium]
MIRNNTVRFVVCLGALFAAVGCGDASSDAIGSKCEQMCQHGDSCPNLYAESDCVSTCVRAVEEADLLGGTCPDAIDNVVGCHTALTCDELTRRAVGSYYDDACVAVEQAATRCVPGDPVEPEPPADELTFACEAVCTAIDDCPTTFAEPDCVEICVNGYRSAENGSEACTGAIVDTLTCQAAMTCSEIENRVLGRTTDDSCRDADRRAEELCSPR